jgi:hypothetical protein
MPAEAPAVCSQYHPVNFLYPCARLVCLKMMSQAPLDNDDASCSAKKRRGRPHGPSAKTLEKERRAAEQAALEQSRREEEALKRREEAADRVRRILALVDTEERIKALCDVPNIIALIDSERSRRAEDARRRRRAANQPIEEDEPASNPFEDQSASRMA